ncbi:actin-like ATPase domain-containing protein [Aureobasidium melanogenum CBS 110374]|uniref:Actin-like ATPase domain-containing protein n=1 Tax=Aureobasidium melanogenum (strain CBS 110374) TaxID=1043003 RepID=A0A074W3M5_AURM1|nr:actin-like ATPase domain-containing protein [Aureobasidium melanogenum CBS 110374]KEQ67730.1 actin-like ATPase domain-containing protein [Aureobasidium melanogenum CBS 110374]
MARSRRVSRRDDTIIVSIDLGSTYSASAATYSGKPDPPEKLEPIMGWAEGDNCEKVPTLLRYEVSSSENVPQTQKSRKRRAGTDESTLFVSQKSAEVVEWGFEVNQDKEFIQFVKLLLDPSQELPQYVSREELEARLKRAGKTAVQAAADYLANLKDHVSEQLQKRFGERMYTTTKVEYILTVPAVWSDAAKDATMKAAELAGMNEADNLSMITEPEAAALCALKTVADVSAREDDVWIVCDAGGGTVDLISYEIKSLSPFLIEEAVSGNGDVCGSGMINMRFQAHVRSRMGAAALDKYIDKNENAWANCLKHFEDYTKKSFNPQKYPDKVYPIPLWYAPDEPDADIEDSHINLSTMDLAEIFRPVIESALKLIDDQYTALIKRKKQPTGIILVGGFGKNKHLMQSIENHFKPIAPTMEVIRPGHSWSAVAVGAVIHRLEGASLVKSRVARSHYGVLTRAYWREGVHSKESKIWDADEEAWYADNVIQWYVAKGQSMVSGNYIPMPFYITSKEASESEIITMIISDEDEAPLEFKPTEQTRRLCAITADLSQVPRKTWKSAKTSKNKKYVYLQHSVGLTFGPGGLQFDARVGKSVVGTARADYEQ